ncbi:SipW-dependent-type signal peptide-containing protein [Ruminococcus gauvreauii]|uniref:SipW-dependent-type signal peptide-containing protein n=1 Tax=Ruminococcus gauvreauii TaxID=438033 RepID=A0ABY5VJY1_9FIRM|nr:SipW-dependent-type signal peptide-containing protein [Ruminococcus gauvreauii]UWP60914.1 SipW-dependent-type signal peptide-containing protein [Ruminococcus gauvreauii]
MANKKLRNTLIALSLVAVVGIGGTLAYLTHITNTETNTFTMGKGITGETDEPKWDEKEAQNFTPGKVIAKDPLIRNLSDESTDPVFAAATIQYQVKNETGEWVDTTYAELDKFINVKIITGEDNENKPIYGDGFNTTDWTMAKDNTIAYYTKEKVAPNGGETTRIFDAVEIDQLALTPDQIESAIDTGAITQFDITKYEVKDEDGNVTKYTYKDYKMQDFQIVITGYLVQGSSEFTTCQQAMQTAFPSIFN